MLCFDFRYPSRSSIITPLDVVAARVMISVPTMVFVFFPNACLQLLVGACDFREFGVTGKRRHIVIQFLIRKIILLFYSTVHAKHDVSSSRKH